MSTPPPLTSDSKVVVRLPNALGDAVMAAPALSRLVAAVGPNAITLVGPKAAIDVLDGGPWMGTAIVLDRSLRRGLGGHLRLARILKQSQIDLAVCFPNSFGSILPFALAKIPHRIGYAKEGRGLLLTATLNRPEGPDGRYLPAYTGERFSQLLDLIPELPSADPHPRLHLTPQGEREYQEWRAKSGLSEREPFFVLVPGAAFGPGKLWMPERYAAVVDELAAKRRARCLVSYGPGEDAIVAAIKSHLKSSPLPDAKMSIHGLKSLVSRSAFMLTNDTGPRHLAVAFDVPAVTIMGPNDPRLTDLDSERGEVVRVDVPCSPCQLKACPLPERICMTELTVERVLERSLHHWKA